MQKILLDIKTTGYDVVRDDIIEITLIDVDTKSKFSQQFSTLVRMSMEVQLQNGILQDALINCETTFSQYINEFYKTINGNYIFTFNVPYIKSFLLQKFASENLILDENTHFVSVKDYHQIKSPSNFVELGKKVMNDYTDTFFTNGFKRCIATAIILEGATGKKLSSLNQNEIRHLTVESSQNNPVILVESSGKIVYNKHTKRYLIMFGKHFGTEVKMLPNDYVDWIVNNLGFSIELRTIIKKLKSHGTQK